MYLNSQNFFHFETVSSAMAHHCLHLRRHHQHYFYYSLMLRWLLQLLYWWLCNCLALIASPAEEFFCWWHYPIQLIHLIISVWMEIWFYFHCSVYQTFSHFPYRKAQCIWFVRRPNGELIRL
jgi:hypothetical protein